MTDKNFEKINIKIAISIQQCTPLHFPKIHISVLRKITIDLLYF